MGNRIRLFHWELESMPEYSHSLPSGQTLWKMWRRIMDDGHSLVGQYIPDPRPKTIGIRWFSVVLAEGPRPPRWMKPDWQNSARFRRVGFYKDECAAEPEGT